MRMPARWLVIADAACLAVLLVWAMSALGASSVRTTLDRSAMRPELGLAWIADLRSSWLILSGERAALAPDLPRLERDGRPLGPAQALHVDIREGGGGRFSLDTNLLRFSTPDGADPRLDQAAYAITAAPRPGRTLNILALAGLLAIAAIAGARRAGLAPRPWRWTGAVAAAAALAVPYALQSIAGRTLLPSPSGILLLAGAAVLPLIRIRQAIRAMSDLVLVAAKRASRLAERLAEAARRALRPWDGTTARPLGWIALGAMVVPPLAWLASLWLAAPLNPNYGDSIAPALWRSGEIVAPPGTVQAELWPTLQIMLPRIAAYLQNAWGIPILRFHDVAALAFGTIGLAALGIAAAALSGLGGGAAVLVATLAMATFLGGWPAELHLGYPALLRMPSYLLGTWGLAAATAVWAWWLAAARGGRGTATAFALAGLVFNLHATYAVILVGVLLAGQALEGLRSRRLLGGLLVSIAGLAAFAVTASPQLVSLATTTAGFAPPEQRLGEHAWWTLMAFRKPSHIFLWDENGVVAPLLWVAALWTLAVAALSPLTTGERALRLAGTGLAVAAFCAIAFAAYAIRPTPLIVGLVLTRAALLLVVGLPIVLAAALALIAQRWVREGATRDALGAACMALALALAGLPQAPWSVRCTLLASLAAACIAVRWPRAATSAPSRSSWAGATAICALLSAVVLAFALAPHKWLEALAVMPRQDEPRWQAVTTFLRERTRVEDMALMPPYPYAMVSAHKPSPTDYSHMGYSVYARWLTGLEVEQIRDLWGADLTMQTPTSIGQWLAANGGILCVVERRYAEIVSSTDRIAALRRTYPSLRLIVAPQDGTVPADWTCGAAMVRPLPYEVVFENDAWRIYRLPEPLR